MVKKKMMEMALEEQKLRGDVCYLLNKLATKIINQIDNGDNWNLTKPSEILRGAEVAVNALGMMYALSPENAGGKNTSGGGPARCRKKNRDITERNRKGTPPS